jgi:hypothetical protein
MNKYSESGGRQRLSVSWGHRIKAPSLERVKAWKGWRRKSSYEKVKRNQLLLSTRQSWGLCSQTPRPGQQPGL